MANYNYTTIGAVLVIILFIIGFIGPWYTISGEFLGVKASIDIGLMKTTFSGGTGGTNIISSIDRSEVDTTMYIAIITMVLAIITLIGILGATFGFGSKSTMQKIGEYCGFLTFIIAIVTIVYYIMNLPDTSDLNALGIEAGLGWGFYLFLLGMIILLATNIWSRFARTE